MDRLNWASIPVEQMNPTTSRQVIHTDRMTIVRISLAKGALVAMHHHENEQVTIMKSGALKFVFGGPEAGREEILRAGDILPIPSNLPHKVEALEDSQAMDVFTPRREDWIRGDDAYLRNPAKS